jgi:TonB-linked outer membrane protein, SusC/RagA family
MKKLILLLFAVFIYFTAFSQQAIRGKIVDDTNTPQPGVSIQINNQHMGTVSDINGNYTITAAPTDTIVFTMVGFATQKIVVGTQTNIDIKLNTEVTGLNEVVVIGYGTVRKSDLTGAVSSMRGDDITKVTTLDPVQELQGKIAGVQVVSTSGAPGVAPMVRVRGVGTFNNSAPIYVVDGVILDDISFLNSADIASYEVLKDASATAIYGSRGANGVILVTTKSGKPNQGKVTINYTGEYSIQSLAKKIDLLSGKEFATISNEINPGSYNNVDLVPNTDWQSLIFHTAPIQSHQLSFSGATQNSEYYIGLGYFNQQGIIDKSGYERFSFKLNNTYHILKDFKLGNNITITPYKQQVAPDVTYSAYRAQPLILPYRTDGSYAGVPNVGNPLADLYYSNNFNKGVRGVGNFYAEASFLKMFTFKSSFDLDAVYNKATSFTPAYAVYYADGTLSQQQVPLSLLSKGYSDKITWLWENTLTFNRKFGAHNFDVVAGYTMQSSNSENVGLTGKNILRDNPNFWYINPSSVYDPTNNVNTIGSIYNNVDEGLNYSMISYLFRVNYSLSSKYLFTATFRRDGSSKFSSQNRFSDFPSLALGWNITQENFMKNISFLNNLKLRASWGIIGNEKIDYSKRYSLTESLITILGTGNTVNSGVSYAKSGNPNLKWESTTQTDIGLEFGVLNNKLTGEFDYYHKVTNDILVDLKTPGYLGNGQNATITYNAGSVLNRGLEAKIDWKDNIGKVNYSIGFVGSYIHNEVLKVGGSSGIDSVLYGGYMSNGIAVTQSRVGLPVGAFYGYKTAGIFQNTTDLSSYPHNSSAGIGDLRFVDVNNDKTINDNDRTYIGSPIPKFIFGFNIYVTYSGFDFSIDVQGQTGNKIFNAKEVVRPDPYNFEHHVMNRWTGPGTSNTEPRPSFGGYNYNPSDRFIQDGSFARLRTVMLGYTLPTRLTKSAYLQKVRLYIKGNNVYTLTKFTGYTPEIGDANVLSNGIDNGAYPVTAVYSIGATLTF